MDELLRILQNMHPEVDYEKCNTLIDDKILDSFDIITLIAEISDQLDISIPAEEIIPENFNSYAALSKLVARCADE